LIALVHSETKDVMVDYRAKLLNMLSMLVASLQGNNTQALSQQENAISLERTSPLTFRMDQQM